MISDEFKDGQQHLVGIASAIDNHVHSQENNSTSKILTEEVISLLEERLRVDYTRRKIGEIVVRKEIETHILQVQVPVRYEKLIVEQVSPEYKLIAQIDLGQENVANDSTSVEIKDRLMLLAEDRKQPISVGFESAQERLSPRSDRSTIYGEIDSRTAASQLLAEIANLPNDDCETVRIEIILKDSKHRHIYQALFDRLACPLEHSLSFEC
jgi:Domain of unknown function (DUF2382)